ncbi:MAG: helix-turn-helix domain-containing protein [Cyclobacteriaceae bacterium]|nr:helix-turn-helix domain-containing protein [Cyclobacteriaceae bacterium HetDA_MAG_MS6]
MIAKKTIPVRQFSEVSGPFSEFRVINLSDIVGSSLLHQQVHRHDFYFMMIMSKGEGEHIIDFNPIQIKAGDVFFMRPGQVHELMLSVGSEGFILEFPAISLPKDFTNSALKSISWHNNVFSFDTKSLVPILQSARNIYTESLGDHPQKNEVIKLHLHLILIELYRKEIAENQPQEQKSDAFSLEQLYLFQELLETNIRHEKSVQEYAQLMNLTPYQLNSITRSTLNKSVSTLINEQVLLEAKRLLLCTPNQINQIAFELGYEDVSYFTRFFKKHVGSSPARFRQNFK